MTGFRPPPLKQQISANGTCGSIWAAWFQDLQRLIGGAPFPLKSYLVAAVPSAALYEGNIIYVSNESGGAVIAFSDGVNWRRCTDRAIIS